MIYSQRMTSAVNFLSSIKIRLSRLTIFQRIVIGNSLVIAIGAIAGTLLTRLLTEKATDLELIILFTVAGTILSVVINTRIVNNALRPFYELRTLFENVQSGSALVNTEILKGSDPDVSQLTDTLLSLFSQLDESNRKLRALSRRAIHVQEDERRRIALSLHDDTGQALSTLIFQLELLEKRLPQGQDEIKARLATVRKLATDALSELRNIIFGLRPSILDDLGLVPAIRWYARTNLEPFGINVVIDVPQEDLHIPEELSTMLFRISQEAINNIRRHSQANTATISLSKVDGAIQLLIKDNGKGFDVPKTTQQALSRQHLGLLGIQERIELVGGNATVESQPGRGTRILVTAPLSSLRDEPYA